MTREEYEQLDVLEKLKLWASIRDGQPMYEVIPLELDPGRWGQSLRDMHNEAIKAIETRDAAIKQLNAICGIASTAGESLEDIKRRVHSGRMQDIST